MATLVVSKALRRSFLVTVSDVYTGVTLETGESLLRGYTTSLDLFIDDIKLASLSS